MTEIAPQHDDIRWTYVSAERRASSSQRNQGIRMANADILFLIDDDSLMYPDCAENIMRVYEADVDRRIVGANATNVPDPPDEPLRESHAEHRTHKQYGSFASAIRQLLKTEVIFVPYDSDYPKHPLPETVASLPVDRWELAAGWGMTFRREIAIAEPFAEHLIRYAATEDSDMSYRASRRGPYVGVRNARLCHLGASSGRVSTYAWTLANLLNPIVNNALHASDPGEAKRRCARVLRRRALINVSKDVYYLRPTLPHTRGALAALWYFNEIYRRPKPELIAWYSTFQSRLFG